MLGWSTQSWLATLHQVTIEIRFRKSLAQERFKSNLEFRNQIIVSSIKLSLPGKYFADISNAVLFCGPLYFFCLVFVIPLCPSVNLCLVVIYWERADLLALVCGVCL